MTLSDLRRNGSLNRRQKIRLFSYINGIGFVNFVRVRNSTTAVFPYYTVVYFMCANVLLCFTYVDLFVVDINVGVINLELATNLPGCWG